MKEKTPIEKLKIFAEGFRVSNQILISQELSSLAAQFELQLLEKENSIKALEEELEREKEMFNNFTNKQPSISHHFKL